MQHIKDVSSAAVWIGFPALILLISFGVFDAHAQAKTTLTSAYVLGCANPAPAAAGKPTVFISKCTTPQWVDPKTSTSVVASVSKTAPQYAHTYTGYASTALLVACPSGAVVSGASCVDGTGKDASALVAQSAVSTFALVNPVTSPATPVTPPSVCPDTFVPLTWTCSVAGKLATCTAPVSP